MSARRFRITFERDEDGWLVRAPELQGCHTWGASIDDARKNIREAIEVSLEDEDRAAIAATAIFDEEIG